VPFEVPKGWCWTTIGECTINRDGERIPVSLAVRKKQKGKIYNYYGAAGIIDKVDAYIFNERLLLVGEDGANLLSRSKNNAFFADGKYWVNNHAHVLDCCSKEILDFVALVINSMDLSEYITGSAQPKLSQDNLHKIPFALPPLAEQRRIITAVESMFKVVNIIDTETTELTSRINQTKSKILELAIQGKLVPQDPNDEPAIELLKRIDTNFKSSDNRPYENLRQGWEIISINDAFDVKMGTSPEGESLNRNNVGMEFHQGKQCFTNMYLGKSDVYSTNPIKTANNNDILLCVRAPVGVVNLSNREVCIGRGLCALSPKPMVNTLFAYYVLQTYKKKFEDKATGTTFKAIGVDTIRQEMFPLPPYAEQKRIVAKIEELFAVLDNIEKSLEGKNL